MTMEWPEGQAALVTGAASGIGLGIARALVAAGAKVALADIDAKRLDDVATELTDAGGTVLAVPFDVGDADQWPIVADRAEETLGPISILCNNAGVTGGMLIDETPLEVWRWVYRINVEAQFVAVSTFLPRFKSRGGRAHIVNTASMAGLVPLARIGAYSSSKAASIVLSQVLRDELIGTDIGVSALCPGTINTRIVETAAEQEARLLGRELDAAAVLGDRSARTANGADPNLVGQQVLEAMQNRQFLIVTHRDWKPLVDRVHTEIDSTFSELDDRYGPDEPARLLAAAAGPVTL